MRKRFFSILTALALCLTLLPTAALADGTDDIGGAAAVQSTPPTQTAGGATTLTGTELTQEELKTYAHSRDDNEYIENGIYLPAGNYYLGGDIYLVGDDASVWPLLIRGGSVTLDLNGHVLDLKGKNINVYPNTTLTLTDSNTNNLSHKFHVEDSGLWVRDESGDKTVSGGVITGGGGNGGGVHVAGTFHMTGGSIVGCSAGNGGGVHVAGTFHMTGGSIVGCSAGNGGGVYVNSSASFTMSVGSIKNCTANNSGGGVYVFQGNTFTMSDDSSIVKCTAGYEGGGVYVTNSTFNMTGGSIEECSAAQGGGVSVGGSEATFTMSSSSIVKCSAGNGGGVFVNAATTFTMSSSGGTNPTITGCTAAQAGGGVFVERQTDSQGRSTDGTFTMDGGSITGCKVGNMPNVLRDGTDNAVHADGTFDGTAKDSIPAAQRTGINAGHAGTSSTDPILIGSVEGLKNFRNRVNNGETTLCAKLVCDIVLNDGTFNDDGTYKNVAGQIRAPEQWTPIGNLNQKYSGTFNGNGKTIKGLYVNVINQGQSQSNGYIYHAGLFGYTDGATIQNVTVDGYVSISGDVTNGNDTTNVGGIVGYAKDTTITGCTNLCTVKSACSSVEYGSFAGGIAGNVNKANEGSYSVTKCRNSGKVILTASYDGLNVGGIAGSSNALVSNCYNTGGIEITSDYTAHHWLCVGGVVGQNDTGAQVSNCCNTGTVTALVTSGSVGDTGGIIGWLSNGTINNCYNTGTVTNHSVSGATSGGGIAGQQSSNGEVKNCYYLTNTAENAVRNSLDNAQQSYVAVKTRSDFANGNVLELLQNGSTSIWTQCGYLEAAEMTLPLLSWQTADTHEHGGNWSSDEVKHRKECSCGKLIEEAHSGGTATCTAVAVCTVCGGSYGSKNEANHSDLQHVLAVAATTTATGNIEYWHCNGCDKYYADPAAAQEIPEADTVIAKLPSGGSSSSPSVADTAVKDIRNAAPGETVRIDMKGETKLPARVLDAAYGKDITLEIDMGNGAVWTINGLDIPKGGVSLNLGVRTGVTSIPAKVIDAVSGEISAVQLRLSHDGAFGLTLTLSLELGKEFDGRFANLYYYNEATGVLEFQCSDKIRGGAASWPFAHASEYVIVIDETDHEPMRFADVADGAYYRDAVLWAAKNGITSGISDTAFGPSLPCTRAQIVTLLWRAAGSPVVNYAMRMDDVNEGSYYAEAVRWALSEGITTGTAANAFSPNEPCTRAQAVTFLFRYAAPAAVTLQELVSGYGDADSVPSFARPAMNWALAAGIVQGNGSNLLPNDTCTRGQIVTFLYRALEK